MKCPNCGSSNPETAQRCDCGYDFEEELERQLAWAELKAWLPVLVPLLLWVILVGLSLIAAALFVLKAVFPSVFEPVASLFEPITSVVSLSSFGILLVSSLLGSLITYFATRKKRSPDDRES